MSEQLHSIRTRLSDDHAPALLIDQFLGHVQRVQTGASGVVPQAQLLEIGPLPGHASLQTYAARGQAALDALVVLKLNGGLGTSMGLDRAKSLLPVRDNMRFIDLIARQILSLRARYGATLPLLLMNSASTVQDTTEALAHYPELQTGQGELPIGFLQHRVPRLHAETLTPIEVPDQPEAAWCPPGHGDIYTALVTSGLLDQLLAQGIRYAFVSNADNLGATVDLGILGYLVTEEKPFLMEVTRRTQADRKGGHLARAGNGKLMLRELAQCPEEELDDFQDTERYRYFNTNNLWVDLQALKNLIEATGALPELALIVNRKAVSSGGETIPVLQLETAMGSAIHSFEVAEAVDVPRTRFSPVKTTDDFLALRSDAYILTDDFRITLNPARRSPVPPAISLDPRFYKTIQDFQLRFPADIPSLLNCDRLTITGDITFTGTCRIEGTVCLHAETPTRVFQYQFIGTPGRSEFQVR